MKVAIAYPPLESEKGIPLLGQNRQFQWASNPWNAYPVVPAYAATMLKEAGHQVIWMDGIVSKQTEKQWFSRLKEEKPSLIIIETKTPVVKYHWEIIDKIGSLFTHHFSPTTVLIGDHVTAFPRESFENSKVDYVLTGGDYDFLLLNLINHLSRGEKLEPGIWHRGKIRNSNLPAGRQGFAIRNSGNFRLAHDLDKLPFIDRDLTMWRLYAYKNSNYSQTPGTYTMFGRDCWWGRCTFCSWTTLFPGQKYRVMSPDRALDEIGHTLAQCPGVKEIMDDSGTFPIGDWLTEFCWGMIDRGYNKKIKIDANMRFNAGLKQSDYDLMAKAGFRFLLYGLESANQKTLDQINKNSKVSYIEPVLKMAKRTGLWPHVTAMVGYPWESKKDAQKTLDMAANLFKKGLIDTLQATVVIPYPGTPLFKECVRNHWLGTMDWNRYDMKEPIMKTEMSREEIMSLVRGIYSSFLTPAFIYRKLKEGLGSWDRFKYYIWMGFKFFSRLIDFRFND